MPFEYGGQTWPDTTVVTEHVRVTFKEGGKDPDLPRIHYKLCYQSYREGHDTYTCQPIREVKEVAPGMMSGLVTTLREAETRTTAYIETTYVRNPPSLFLFQSMTPEEIEHWSEVRVLPNSNQIEIPKAKPYVVPEPGLVLMLAIGVLCLATVGWRRRTQ